MKIQLKKFGETLTSRQLGSEAWKAFQPSLRDLLPNDNVEVDFSGVLTLSPSWADEFLSPLLDLLSHRLVLMASDNLSVQTTIKLLEEANKTKFTVRGQ